MNRLVSSLLAIGIVAALPTGSGAQVPVQRLQRAADSLLLSLHQRGLFNGAVVLGRGEQEVYARGFGPANLQAGVAFTPDTPADGGSVAKTLTAAAVFMLVKEGRLRLDDAVQRHIPEYPHAETRVWHLLAHSAGLPAAEYGFFDELIPPARIRTTALFLDVLRQRSEPPAFPPGTRFSYSSLGFDVAALMVERITGQSWEAFLRERVLDPLAMHSTFLRLARLADWSGVRTLSYRRDGDSLVVHDVFDNEGFYGGSNLYFSARDLHRWSRSFYTQPVLGPTALSGGMEAAVLRDRVEGNGGRSALNLLSWYYPNEGRLYHYPGSLQGFWSSVYRNEDKRYSVIYTSNNGIPQWLRPMLTRALIEIVEGRPPPALDVPDYAAVGADDIGAITGVYSVDGVGAVTIGAAGRRASIRIDDGIEYPAFFLGDGQLYVPGLDVWVGFPSAPGRPFQRLTWLSVFHVAGGRRIDGGEAP
jgi:CubicO group peptidase (beta-lactamase class C family)